MGILSDGKEIMKHNVSLDKTKLRFLDLFAGAGGLSEGFIRAGFTPVAHVEMDSSACFTLRTRAAYHWLCKQNQKEIYEQYLNGEIDRNALYSKVPEEVIDSVIEAAIGPETRKKIIEKIDAMLDGNKLDLIIGGPPCQAYSLAGRSRDSNKMLGDKRNYLYLEYVEFLKKYEPSYFVFENVTGLLSAKDIDGVDHFLKVKKAFNDCGYAVEYKVLNAKDYGVLQNRKRIILIGKKGVNAEGFYPKLEPQKIIFKVKDVFSDLPVIKSGCGTYGPTKVLKSEADSYLVTAKIKTVDSNTVTYHISRYNNDRDLKIYKTAVEEWNAGGVRIKYNELDSGLQTHKNKDVFTDKFKVVGSNLSYSQTVVAHIAKDGHYYIHPDINQNRSITPREAARLQSFPDDFYFESKNGKPSKSVAFRQIGNAVPVLLAEKVAEALKKEMTVN